MRGEILYAEKKNVYYHDIAGVGKKDVYVDFVIYYDGIFSGLCQVLGPTHEATYGKLGSGSKQSHESNKIPQKVKNISGRP